MKRIFLINLLFVVFACSCTAVYPVKSFTSKIRSNPDEESRLFNRGYAHYVIKDYQNAVELLEETVHIDSLDHEAIMYLGLSYVYIDSLSKAADVLRPEYPFANFAITNSERGLALNTTGHLEEAIDANKKALDAGEPHPSQLHSKIGVLSYNTRKYEDAIREFTTVINDDSDVAKQYNSYMNLAFSYTNIGDYEKAIDVYKTITNIQPEQKANALFGIGNIKYKQGKLDEAFEYYKETIKVNENITGAFYNLCLISFKKKNIDAANMYFNKLKELDPNTAQKLHNAITGQK